VCGTDISMNPPILLRSPGSPNRGLCSTARSGNPPPPASMSFGDMTLATGPERERPQPGCRQRGWTESLAMVFDPPRPP